MDCPRCKTTLRTRTAAGVEVDECPACQGIWFDADELRRVKDEADPDLSWMDFELWRHPDRFRVTSQPTECPKCHVPLVAVDYDRTGVEVEFCTRCHGTWLDVNQLERLIDRLSEEVVSKEVPEYLRAALKEAKELITGRERFLSEWRDFRTVLRLLQYRVLSEHARFASLLAEFQAKSQF